MTAGASTRPKSSLINGIGSKSRTGKAAESRKRRMVRTAERVKLRPESRKVGKSGEFERRNARGRNVCRVWAMATKRENHGHGIHIDVKIQNEQFALRVFRKGKMRKN